MRIFRSNGIGKRIMCFCVISVLLSCAKGDDPLISFQGTVFSYVGPYISNIGANANDSDLSPAVGVTVELHRLEGCGFGHCGPVVKHDEKAVTDANGNYSFTIRTGIDSGYYPSVVIPENFDFSSAKGSYEDRKIFDNRIVFADIIIVDAE